MMKKLCTIVLVVALAGCATLDNYFCKPDASQVTQSETNLAAAQAAINVLAPMAALPEIQAVVAGLNLAIPIFNKVMSQTCVNAKEFADAINAVQSANSTAKAIGYRGVLNDERAKRGLAPL